MKKLKLELKNVGEILTREQLKQVVGGIGSGCPVSECEDSGDCTDPDFPKCHKSTCLSTGEPSNICGYDV